MATLKPSTIDEYISAAPPEAREKLHEIRTILREVAPEAREAIKWGSPVFEENRILFAFSAHKTHINFMPTHTTLDHFRTELADYKTGKDTIQFPYDKPLPADLIRRVAAFRLRAVREEGVRWMQKKRAQ